MIRKKSAFTLIEVILAITILSTLTLLTTQAISSALKARTKIQAEVDDVSSLRDAMRLIRTDINMAYHHRDFEKEILDLATKPATQAPVPAQPGAPPPPPQQPVYTYPQQQPQRQTKRYDPTTGFIGSDNKIDFVTMNSARTVANTVQADFIEVGYDLNSCKSLTDDSTSQCLYRRTQNIIDNDVSRGGSEMVLLENVSEFKLRYIGEGKQDWVSSWNSTSRSSDGGTKGKFPDAVEVSLSIERDFSGKKRTYSMQYVIPIHFPNNAPASSSNTTTTIPGAPAQPPATGGGGND